MRVRAFTLMELMVVIIIIAAVVAMVVPMIGMASLTRIQAATETVSIATSTAKRYAARPVSFELDLDPNTPGQQKARYVGTAALFLMDEIRIIESHQRAENQAGVPLALLNLHGFRDLRDRDYIAIPRGSGVVGIVRTGSGEGDLRLLAPPFAVRFDELGNLVAADESASQDVTARYVYYDGDYDGRVNLSKFRKAGHDPEPFDRRHPQFRPDNGNLYNISENKVIVPLERIECVIGVLVYDRDAFIDELMTLRSSGDIYIDKNNPSRDTSPHAWLMANGEMLMFNRLTGRVIKND